MNPNHVDPQIAQGLVELLYNGVMIYTIVILCILAWDYIRGD